MGLLKGRFTWLVCIIHNKFDLEKYCKQKNFCLIFQSGKQFSDVGISAFCLSWQLKRAYFSFFSSLQQAAILKFAGGKGPSYAKLFHNGAKTFLKFWILCSNDFTIFFIFKNFTFSLIYALNVNKIQFKNCRSMWCWFLRPKEFGPIVCANPTFLLFIVPLDLQ